MKKLLLICLLSVSVSFAQKKLNQVSLKSLEGKTIETKELTDNDVVVFSLWSTKCPPCRRELNAINKLHKNWQLETGIPFYAVSIDKKQDRSKVVQLANKNNWSFSVLLDEEKKLRKALGVWTVPLTLVIKNNKIVYRQIGYSNGEEKKLYKAIKRYAVNKKIAAL